ncbi:MAG: hypothetical protein J5584_09795 [Clostridia bacterium]|jgi:drug/metabolite transporter (DMT)-like permease|nr:hypothetical protein [Clostridia bacterium]
MVSRRYVGDYRLENVKDKNGKLVTKPVYKGKYYVFEKSAEEAGRGIRSLTACAVLAVLTLVLGLALVGNKGFASQYYTVLPMVICTLPLAYLCVAVYYLLTSKLPVIRERKEKMSDRVAKCSFVTMLLAGWNLSGILLAFVLKLSGVEKRPFTAGDGVYIAASLLFFGAVLGAFLARKSVAMLESAGVAPDTAGGGDNA